jgi:hypothetical protein
MSVAYEACIMGVGGVLFFFPLNLWFFFVLFFFFVQGLVALEVGDIYALYRLWSKVVVRWGWNKEQRGSSR